MDFIENENKILEFWKKNKIFDKLREKNKGKEPWSFLDGPITANNPMGVHHAWGRTYKDMFQRYKAMKGFDLRHQNGFDCQGLWVEVEVEKELGFKSKKDIEKYGIGKFVNKCKERVLKYSTIQTDQSIRLGQWMRWDKSYFTMSDQNNYAIWHFLKQCKEKGFLYKGRDSVPWCPRCGTSISQHEILTEEYKEITHKAVFVRYPVVGQKKTYFLVWTTTAWTLPGNVALAVKDDLEYVKVKDKEKDVYILLKSKADLVDGEIVEIIKGKELEGLEYKGLFDKLPAVKKKLSSFAPSLATFKHKVILWDQVTEEEGTGIVHIAPGCGAEDFGLSKTEKLPVIDLTDNESNYRHGFDELSGKFVGAEETREQIFEILKKQKGFFKIEDYKHRYPTCWRCKTELIFRVVDEWYISMEKLREPLMESAKKIKWMPGFGLDRELDWLKNMNDWLISKKRYWGLALPIFECECGNFDVIGSKQELKQKAVEGWDKFEGNSPHRPWVDNVQIKCSKCGKIVSRIKDVGTPWLDAGIVPFSTLKYFEDKDYWKKWFPIHFITESFPGQFKNWFYVLLVMSQVLEGRPPFERVLGFATAVDENGEEMHKSKGNAIWFDDAVEKIGADVMRWMYMKQNPANNMRFGFNIAKETSRKILTLWNSFVFFKTYAQDEKIKYGDISSKNILDKWIISKLHKLIKNVNENLDKFEPAKASIAIESFFINDLSLWYIRRSRKRFEEASSILHYVLLELTKLLAPMMPFLAEEIYQKLKQERDPESVHLCDYPSVDEKLIDNKLQEKMALVREVVTNALAKRTEAEIRVRQPLSALKIKDQKLKDDKELLELIKAEVNVKKIVFDEKIKQDVELDTKISKDLKQEGNLREIIRQIQSLRKKAGLTPQDKAEIYYYSENKDLNKLVDKNKKDILAQTRSGKITENKDKKGEFGQQQELTINSQTIWLAILCQN